MRVGEESLVRTGMVELDFMRRWESMVLCEGLGGGVVVAL